MSTSNSVPTTSSFEDSFTTSNVISTTTAAGVPGILAGNGTCGLNVEEDSSRFGKVVWTNCCIRENPALNCPPQGQNYTSCPAGYLNCADPINHAEMCLVASEVFGYSDSRALNKKCCPKNFSCGLAWESPCQLVPGITNITFPPYTNPEKVVTNALYLSVNGVFAGCNDSRELSPGAIGAIIAVAILGLCFLCGSTMWLIRRRLYRDPTTRRHYARAQKVVSDRRGRAKNLGITITRDYRVDERGMNSMSRLALPLRTDSPRWMGIGRMNYAATAQRSTV